jgi:polynucleotide 5'-hydroxyl-kinase GRC3/NOL9
LLPDQTEDEDDEDQTPPIVLVKGPKRSGKSTFARATLNNLLNRYEKVAWLECDLGQGEFSPGGVVGLWIVDAPILGTSASIDLARTNV